MRGSIPEIKVDDYDYDLPDEKIAQYPLDRRDSSRLLVYDGSGISSDTFANIGSYIPGGTLLVFNNTRVIRARLKFRKKTGANIEILCLEPVVPADYERSFSSKEPVEWKCIVGNLSKWKDGTLKLKFIHSDKTYSLAAEKISPDGDAWKIRFSWDHSRLTFGEVIEAAGHIPLPPYIKREDERDDVLTYQTVYSKISGSVAAPTAGLHFTDELLKGLPELGIMRSEVTLHVGAGTFQPVRAKKISGHEMHTEHFTVKKETIESLIDNYGKITAVGTTSARCLESIYWIGIQLLERRTGPGKEFLVSQWEPYGRNASIPSVDALSEIVRHMNSEKLTDLTASTGIIILPGYKFRMISGLITNFHQPKSTLLLLISAWIGDAWKEIYEYALKNNFRFLSYGDSSLLFKPDGQ